MNYPIYLSVKPFPSVLSIVEKTQLVKQKSNINGKRGDKRSLKVPVRTKYDSFNMKTGFASFGSAAGGNNFFGMTFCLIMHHFERLIYRLHTYSFSLF